MSWLSKVRTNDDDQFARRFGKMAVGHVPPHPEPREPGGFLCACVPRPLLHSATRGVNCVLIGEGMRKTFRRRQSFRYAAAPKCFKAKQIRAILNDVSFVGKLRIRAYISEKADTRVGKLRR